MLSAALARPAAAQRQALPLDLANLDTSCSACRNIFTYADGGWIRRNPIPGDQST